MERLRISRTSQPPLPALPFSHQHHEILDTVPRERRRNSYACTASRLNCCSSDRSNTIKNWIFSGGPPAPRPLSPPATKVNGGWTNSVILFPLRGYAVAFFIPLRYEGHGKSVSNRQVLLFNKIRHSTWYNLSLTNIVGPRAREYRKSLGRRRDRKSVV